MPGAFLVERKAGPGPFLRDQAGKALTRKGFVAEVRKAMDEAGIDSQDISGHSFRIGTATAAAQCGTTEAEIKALGRWRSREYQGYMRRDESTQGSLARKLAGGRGG